MEEIFWKGKYLNWCMKQKRFVNARGERFASSYSQGIDSLAIFVFLHCHKKTKQIKTI
jgi:hypothetical protein